MKVRLLLIAARRHDLCWRRSVGSSGGPPPKPSRLHRLTKRHRLGRSTKLKPRSRLDPQRSRHPVRLRGSPCQCRLAAMKSMIHSRAVRSSTSPALSTLLSSPPSMSRLTGTSSFLPVRVCGRAGAMMISSGMWRGYACVRMRALIRSGSLASSQSSVGTTNRGIHQPPLDCSTPTTSESCTSGSDSTAA